MESRAVLSLDEQGKTLPWLGAVLDVLDSRLRRRQGVFEYTRRPDCLFRIQVITSCGDIFLSDGTHVRPGDRLISLHMWNEQFPAFPAAGPTLAWAQHFNRAFDISLRELAHFLDERRDLGFKKIAVPASRSFRQRMHWLGENILISMIVLAHNATALRADTLRRDRTIVFLSRQTLQRRYGLVDDQLRRTQVWAARAERSVFSDASLPWN